MKNLLLLLKIEFSRLFNRKSKKKNIIVVSIIAIFALAYVFVYEYMAINYLNENNAITITFPILYLLIHFALFTFTLPKAKDYIYSSDDFLFSLPIKDSVILASRTLSVLILNTLISIGILLPATIIYGMFASVGVSFYVISVVMMLIVPIIPTVITLILGQFIAYLVNKLGIKRGIETIIVFITTLFILYASMNLQNIGKFIIENSDLSGTNILNDLLLFFNNIIYEHNLYNIIGYSLVAIASFVSYIYIFKGLFMKITKTLNNEKVGKAYISKDLKSNSSIYALIIKEIRTFIGIPIYVLNVLFGVCILFIGSVASIFYDISSYMQIEDSTVDMFTIIFMAIGFIISMTNSCSISLSLEGKNFWIIKSLPIKSMDIIKFKIIFNLLLIIPLTAISVFILSFTLGLTATQFILISLFIILYSIFISFVGILLNIKFPKFDFVAPVEVVKQSLSVFLALVFPMIIVMTLGTIMINLNISIGDYMYSILTVIFILDVMFYYIVKNIGVKMFNKLQV